MEWSRWLLRYVYSEKILSGNILEFIPDRYNFKNQGSLYKKYDPYIPQMSETFNKNEIKYFYYLINLMVNIKMFSLLLEYTVLTWNTVYHLTTKYNGNNVNSIKFIEPLW